MAKIRVYELARELNTTNKELIERLRELEYDVKSHMSAFDEEEVDTIKQHLRGKKDDVTVEVTRVKPTVIRRRKRQLPAEEMAPEEGPDETQVEAEETAAEPEAAEVETEATAEPVEAAAAEESMPVAEAEAETESVEAPAEEAAEGEPQPVETETEPTEVGTTAVEETAEVEAGAEAKAEPAPEKEAPAKPAKKKKGKKESPAKIIKLPVGPPPETLKPSAPKPAPEEETEPGQVVALDAEREERRRGKKKTEEVGKDKKFFKKKISFRRKEVIEGEDLYDETKIRGKKGRKAAKAKPAKGQKTQITTPKAIKRRIKIDEAIMLSDLAKRMGIKAGEMIKTLMAMGVMATVNQTIDFETASLVAVEFGYEAEKAAFEEEAVLSAVAEDDTGKLVTRSPVVTIMGHVDHGKTSLLDVIRKTKVTEMEAGGITQHIGAYSVQTPRGLVSFLDTPGHEAFTAMRARGAGVTDIVVLVVAADDGVMPQTVEAINHSKAAGVPIIVAVNKIDKANADPERVIRQLAESGLVPEDWGGDTIFVHVSAKQRTGIEDLLEMILLQAEVLELKANPDKLARGHVIEAKLDSGRGPVATVLIQDGTLQAGQSVVCGVHYGKIRAMIDDRGKQVDTAGPSIPVEILGLSGVPVAGDEMVALADERAAKQVSEHRLAKQRSMELAKSSRVSLESLFDKMKEEEVKELNLIIKADVHGSIEALKDSLTDLSTEEVKISVIHSATGTITESDVSLAAVSDAIILGFNVRPNPKVHELAQEEHVDMRFYDVIYNAIKDIKDAIVGMMASTFEERLLGRAEVRQTFHVPKVGTIAGCYVTDGKIERNQNIRVLRDGVVIYDGKIASLKRYKDDVKEAAAGYECGINVEKFNDVKVGDVMECYYMEEIKPELK
jgi:translation initiation factor IF-2